MSKPADRTRYCVQVHHPENHYRQREREWTLFGGLCHTLRKAEDNYNLLRSASLATKERAHFRLIKCEGRAIDGVEVLKECQTDNGIAYDPREPVQQAEGMD